MLQVHLEFSEKMITFLMSLWPVRMVNRVILSSSSPFFQNILRRNKHSHPLIYMRGMKSEDLVAVLDFIYCGETNVYQEGLDSFLAVAEELQLKGLMVQITTKLTSKRY